MVSLKSKIYLDSSVPSAYYDRLKLPRQRITRYWWNEVMKQNFEAYISVVTDTELNGTKDMLLRKKLLYLVKDFFLLELSEDAVELAGIYVQNGIVPEKYRNDALHIAIATLNGIDILVSWNFSHLVNLETRRKVKGINLFKGYKEIDIVSPEELGGGQYA